MINKCTNLALILFLLLIPLSPLTAQTSTGFSFIENKGQWADTIRFKTELPSGMLHIVDQGFAYSYLSIEDLSRIAELQEHGSEVGEEPLRGHNYRVSYLGGNTHPKYSSSEKRSNYNNYFIGNDSSKWKGHVGLFGKVLQQDVYEGIDVAIYSKGTSIKYDFMVAAGADPSEIKMKFEGVQPVLTEDGHLKITTSVNEITEQAPYAYQMIEGREVSVPCHYVLHKNVVTFSLPEGYDTRYPLIIDPELVFTTFSGGSNFSSGYYSYSTTYDNLGSLYAGGVPLGGSFSTPQWPTTPGAFQTTYNVGATNITCINKYNPLGSALMYSTYFGGTGSNDLPHSMIVNEDNELILAGTAGSFNIPFTTGCFDSTRSNSVDIFIAHFTEDGSGLIGATYVGGDIGNTINGIDMYSTAGYTSQNKTSPLELGLDDDGNIWVVANTSCTDFPITANALQSTMAGGTCDGVIFALDPTCSNMIYGTYLGGTNIDVVYGIQFNSSGNIVICGGTRSTDFPTTANAYMPMSPGTGDWDGYVAIIDKTSGDLLNATYLGTNQNDQSTHVQVDPNDNVYILGRTMGNYPISAGVYHMPGTDLFINKFSPDLSASLLTTRMGNPQGGTNFFPTAFLLDECTNVYITGLSRTSSTPLNNMPLTPDAFQTNLGNFWFGVLEPNFSGLMFGTYYGRIADPSNGIGGDHTHCGINRLDPDGILYQSLCVNSPDYPGTTPNSWSEFSQNSLGQDVVSFKFAFLLAGVQSGFELQDGQDTAGCAPFDVTFENTSTMAVNYVWDFGDGSSTSSQFSPTHTYTDAGTYTVTLYAYNDTACIPSDTSYATILVYDPNLPVISVTDTLICEEVNQLALFVSVENPSLNNYYKWQPFPAIIGADNQQSVIVNPALASQFIVTVWDSIPGVCSYSSTDTLTIDYKPKILEILTNDTLLCLGDSMQMVVESTFGYSFSWSPELHVFSPTDLEPLIVPPATGIYTITASYPGCGDTSKSIYVEVDPPAGISFVAQPDALCVGASVSFTPIGDSLINELQWDFGDGTTRFTTAQEGSTEHAYDSPGTKVVGITIDPRVCPDTTFSLTVDVYPLPLVDLGPDTTICLDGMPVYLQNLKPAPSADHHYIWNTGDTSDILKIVQPGVYSLKVVTEPVQCTTLDEVEIKKDCYVDIPNAFTPNGDGENDYFFPRSLLTKSVTNFRMEVFNRWGQMVFQTERIDGRGWDGRFNNIDQGQGVYIYRIEVAYTNDRSEHYEGNVTLLR